MLVPADEGSSASGIATALADVGGRLRDSPVTAIVADKIDFESARMLSDLQLYVKPPDGDEHTVAVEAKVVPAGVATESSGPSWPEEPAPRTAHPLAPVGRVIVSIQPVVVEPLGVAIAQAADAVVLCVRVGVTDKKAARRTIELIGRERVVGAFLIH